LSVFYDEGFEEYKHEDWKTGVQFFVTSEFSHHFPPIHASSTSLHGRDFERMTTLRAARCSGTAAR